MSRFITYALAVSFCAVLLTLLFMPSEKVEADWRTDQITEVLAIDATAATTDQTSSAFVKPQNAKGILILVQITAGTSLSLDVDLQWYNPGADTWRYAVANVPNGGLSGVGTTAYVFGQLGGTAGYGAGVSETPKNVILPTRLRIQMDHGNANAATYKVYYQWLFGG